MLSKNKAKHISSLKLKKYRDENSEFVVEGEKMVLELINSKVNIKEIFVTSEWMKTNKLPDSLNYIEIILDDLKKISSLTTPQGILAVVEQPKPIFNRNEFLNNLILVLDTIQDPGNLGTIMRIADWFGINQIVCSMETADVFNPKVVQATMGAIFRVNVFYHDLISFFQNIPDIPVYGTFLNGTNLYTEKLTKHGIIVMGNESKGISTILEPFVTKKLLIPNFPPDSKSSESLNVGIATAIVCAEFRRIALINN